MAGRILIVAREGTRCMFPPKIMESNEYSIEFSENVDRLLELLDEKHYDLLFLELNMLTSNHRDHFYRAIKDKSPGTKAILIASGPTGWRLKEALDAGVYACIQKPFEEEEIATIIQHILSSSEVHA